jgi:hypothetical protein
MNVAFLQYRGGSLSARRSIAAAAPPPA